MAPNDRTVAGVLSHRLRVEHDSSQFTTLPAGMLLTGDPGIANNGVYK